MGVASLRVALTVLLVLTGSSACLLLATFIAPAWIVAEDVPIAALPYSSGASANTTTTAVNATIVVAEKYTIGTFEYCFGATCAYKGADAYATESTCGRSAGSVRAMYGVGFAFSLVGFLAAIAGSIAAGRRAFASSPTGLSALELAAAQPPAVMAAREPLATNVSVENDGSPLRDGRQSTTTDAETPDSTAAGNHRDRVRALHPFSGASMSMQTAPPDEESGVIDIAPTATLRAQLERDAAAREATAKRHTLLLAAPLATAFVTTGVAAGFLIGLQQVWLHCGETTQNALTSAVRSVALANEATVPPGARVTAGPASLVLVFALLLQVLALVALAPAVMLARAAARATVADESGVLASGIAMGSPPQDRQSPGADGDERVIAPPRLVAGKPDPMDDTLVSRAEASRSPPLRSPGNDLFIESPQERAEQRRGSR